MAFYYSGPKEGKDSSFRLACRLLRLPPVGIAGSDAGPHGMKAFMLLAPTPKPGAREDDTLKRQEAASIFVAMRLSQ